MSQPMRVRQPGPACRADAESRQQPEQGKSSEPAGRRARLRFAGIADALPACSAPAGGSIALSFAVVSFRNWPKPGA